MFLRKVYAFWCLFWFLLVFFLIYPFFVLFIQRKEWHEYGRFLNRLWAIIVFNATFLPAKVEYRFKLDKRKKYIFCANHSSYLDIPSLAYGLKLNFVFIGKASLAKVPMFGYMFRRLYISVDRDSKLSRYKTMIRCAEELDKGVSIAIFPEGTIPKGKAPAMIPFKEGAFRLGIEKQVPIVPVSIAYNWIILPDNGKLDIKRHVMKVIVHEPIDTTGMTLDQIEELSQKTYSVIDQELKKQNESYR